MVEKDGMDLVRRLVQHITHADYTLHRGGSYLTRCQRLKVGLAQTGPKDCTCGLDALLAAAYEFIGEPSKTKDPPEPSREKAPGTPPTALPPQAWVA